MAQQEKRRNVASAGGFEIFGEKHMIVGLCGFKHWADFLVFGHCVFFFSPFNSCFFHVNKSKYLSSFSVTIMRLNFESEVGANKFLVHVYICYMYI